jgi:hypothetical protein
MRFILQDLLQALCAGRVRIHRGSVQTNSPDQIDCRDRTIRRTNLAAQSLIPPLRLMNFFNRSECGLYLSAYRRARDHFDRVRLSTLASTLTLVLRPAMTMGRLMTEDFMAASPTRVIQDLFTTELCLSAMAGVSRRPTTARPDRNESGFPRHAGGASLRH